MILTIEINLKRTLEYNNDEFRKTRSLRKMDHLSAVGFSEQRFFTIASTLTVIQHIVIKGKTNKYSLIDSTY